MATITTDLICNLNQPVAATFLHGNLFSQDNAGNTINVHVMDNGEPATIGGTVSANVIRADGNTVAVSGSLSGNQCSVVLPQACYAVPGRVEIIIKLTQSTTITTIAAIVANVYRSTTDTVVDPGTIIPSIQALIEEIEDAVDSIPVDYSGLLATIAADYSSSKTYPVVGMYAWQGGVLKRNIVPITTAETYTAAHWTNVVIGDDLSALKSALSVVSDRTLLAETDLSKLTDVRKGYFINSVGRYGSETNSVAGRGNVYSPYIYAGSTITVNSGYKCNYSVLTIPIPGTGTPTSEQRLELAQNVSAGTTITIQHDGYLGISVAYADESAIPEATTAIDFMDAAVTVNLFVKTVKEKVLELSENNQFKHIETPYGLQWTFGDFSSSGSKYKNRDGLRFPDYLHIQPGSKVTPAQGAECQYRFIPDSTGTAEYTSFTGNAKTFSESGKMMMTVRYTNTSTKVENSAILDLLAVDLVFLPDELPTSDVFSRPLTTYGNIPASDYVGHHTDETGFNQTTEYDTALALWRGLPALAPNYITETDLGEIEAVGKHTYRYDITPVYQARSGKTYPQVFIVTSVHGHEKSATYGLYYLIKDMLDHSQDDPVLFYLRNFVKFTILPMANPYGWDANSALGTHGGIRYNENGVNINRNYGTSTWHNFDDDPDYTTPGYNYRGESPFSEIETQRIRDQIIANAGNDCLIIDIHTNGTNTTSAADITYVSLEGSFKSKSIEKGRESNEQYLCANKLHMDNLYDVDLGLNVMYGTQQYPATIGLTCESWGLDSVRTVATTLEVPPGSTTGFLGEHLSKYSPDLIKLCGEMIGNYICKMLHNLGDALD